MSVRTVVLAVNPEGVRMVSTSTGDCCAYRHIQAGARESASHRVDELAGHAEIAQFDDTFSRQEDIRRLDVPVNRLLGVQVRKSLQDLQRP